MNNDGLSNRKVSLEQLLQWRRYEEPNEEYFNQLPRKVIARIEESISNQSQPTYKYFLKRGIFIGMVFLAMFIYTYNRFYNSESVRHLELKNDSNRIQIVENNKLPTNVNGISNWQPMLTNVPRIIGYHYNLPTIPDLSNWPLFPELIFTGSSGNIFNSDYQHGLTYPLRVKSNTSFLDIKTISIKP